MPLYFFDWHDACQMTDEIGTDLADLQEARVAAVRLWGKLLCDIADVVGNGDQWVVKIRDEGGVVLASLLFVANWVT